MISMCLKLSKITSLWFSQDSHILFLRISTLALHVLRISSPNCCFYSSYARYKNDPASHPHILLIGEPSVQFSSHDLDPHSTRNNWKSKIGSSNFGLNLYFRPLNFRFAEHPIPINKKNDAQNHRSRSLSSNFTARSNFFFCFAEHSIQINESAESPSKFIFSYFCPATWPYDRLSGIIGLDPFFCFLIFSTA